MRKHLKSLREYLDALTELGDVRRVDAFAVELSRSAAAAVTVTV